MVGARFKEELKRVGVTQGRLAEQVGHVDQAQISRAFGKRTLRLETLLRLLGVAAIDGVDLRYVFTGVRDPQAGLLLRVDPDAAERLGHLRELGFEIRELSRDVADGGADDDAGE